MKKFFSIFLALAMILSMTMCFVSCTINIGEKDNATIISAEINADGELILTFSDKTTQNLGIITDKSENNNATIVNAVMNENNEVILTFSDGKVINIGVINKEVDNPQGNIPVGKDYNLAIGVVVTPNLDISRVTETVAAIVTDADGKIVLCRFDCIDFNAKYTDDVLNTTAPISKVAQGEAYDFYYPMPAGTWFVQADALAKSLIGKTQAEVAAIALNEMGKLTDADLAATCSIAVNDLLKAVDNAFKSEHKTAFKSTATEFKAGVAITADVRDTANDGINNAKFTADFAATVLVDGKIVANILDCTDVELKNIADGAAAEVAYKGTKREQGEAYDSYSFMPAGTWYVQVDALSAKLVGKTQAEVAAIALNENGKLTDADLSASCSIAVSSIQKTIVASIAAAK